MASAEQVVLQGWDAAVDPRRVDFDASFRRHRVRVGARLVGHLVRRVEQPELLADAANDAHAPASRRIRSSSFRSFSTSVRTATVAMFCLFSACASRNSFHTKYSARHSMMTAPTGPTMRASIVSHGAGTPSKFMD